MRVLVTGASGFIGSAVVPELLSAGHQVAGLARSDASAAALTAAGAEAVRGSLDDLERLREAAAASDGVIHLAFRHDLAFAGDFPAAIAADRAALSALGAALEGSDRPLVIASGVAGLAPGRVLTEDDAANPSAQPRSQAEADVVALGDRGVRGVSVRLAPTVHGAGDHGFVAVLAAAARRTGVAGYIGDGTHRWAAVHRSDAARLFRLAVESAPAGSVLHGVAEEGVPTRAIAEALGRGLGLPVRSFAPEDASEQFGFLGGFFGLDIQAGNSRTRELLGWEPTGPGLIEDIDQGHYPG